MARELPKPEPPQSSTTSRPTHEQIAARAYQIFIERGQPEGRDQEHWLEAEAQLTAAMETRHSADSTQKMNALARRPGAHN